jgi:hypothetical protein
VIVVLCAASTILFLLFLLILFSPAPFLFSFSFPSLSFFPSLSHLLLLTFSFSPSPSHLLLLTFSFSPSPSHLLLLTFSQVLEDQPHDPRAADIWSIGVTLFFILKRAYPWGDDLSEEELLCAIKSVPVDLRSFSSKARTLLKGMLCLNPKGRMTGIEARSILKEALGVPAGKATVGPAAGLEGGLMEKSSNATVAAVTGSPQKVSRKEAITESPQKKTRKDSASGHTRDSSRG